MKPPRVLILQPINQAGIDVLSSHGIEVITAPNPRRETLLDLIKDADGLIVRTTSYRIDGEVMDNAHRLRVIGRHGVGVDHIDIAAAMSRNITVVNAPEANSQGVAEYTIGLMLSVCRYIPEANQAVREGRWTDRERLIGEELYERTLGIIGLGRVGSRVGRIARLGFGMHVLYYDIVRKYSEEQAIGVEFTSFEDVIGRSDVLTLHTPLTSLTHHMMNGTTLQMMKEGSYLINASRGEVLELDALVNVLKSHHLTGAALDVLPEEPIDSQHELLTLPNVVLSPHMASHSKGSMVRMSLVAEDVVRVLEGEHPRFPVTEQDPT